MSSDAVDWNVVRNMIRLSYEHFVCAVARGWKLRLRLRRLVNPESSSEATRAKRPTRALNQRKVKGEIVHDLTAERRSSSHNDSGGEDCGRAPRP